MPIRGRTLRETAQALCDHVNRVLSTTVTQARLVVITVARGTRAHLAFRRAGGQPGEAVLHTRFGPMGLFLGQVCEFVETTDGLRELRTVSYRFSLTPEGAAEPLLRWEYVRNPVPYARWCRHHLQGPVELRVHGHVLSLNDLHLPTGYVPVEEILRFCLVDLGVRPLSADWDRTLREGYTR